MSADGEVVDGAAGAVDAGQVLGRITHRFLFIMAASDLPFVSTRLLITALALVMVSLSSTR